MLAITFLFECESAVAVVLACKDRSVSNTSSKELQGKRLGTTVTLVQKRWWVLMPFPKTQVLGVSTRSIFLKAR